MLSRSCSCSSPTVSTAVMPNWWRTHGRWVSWYSRSCLLGWGLCRQPSVWWKPNWEGQLSQQQQWQALWQQGQQDWLQEVQQLPLSGWQALEVFWRQRWSLQPADVVLSVLRTTANAWQCPELRSVPARSYRSVL